MLDSVLRFIFHKSLSKGIKETGMYKPLKGKKLIETIPGKDLFMAVIFNKDF